MSAVQAQLTVVEYPIPRTSAFPYEVAVGDDGVVWYTDQANGFLGRFDPATQTFTDYAIPTAAANPYGLTTAPDGGVWYAAQNAGVLGRLDPATKAIREYPLPISQPHSLAWHQGVVWFTAPDNNAYGRLDPVTASVIVYSTPWGAQPHGIAVAPDGYLWLALSGTNRLGRVDPANGSLVLSDLPSGAARPRRLVVSNDGVVWYTDHARGYLGRYDPSKRQWLEWQTPMSAPYGLALGPDGRIWCQGANASLAVAFDPRTQAFATAAIPTPGATVRQMVTDFTRGRVWLALSGTQRIGKLELGVPVTFFGNACAGGLGLPSLMVAGVPRIGERMYFGLSNTNASYVALFAGFSDSSWGSLRLPFELASVNAPGCYVNVAPEFMVYAGPQSTWSMTVPLNPALSGVQMYMQWGLFGDPPSKFMVTSYGMRLRVIGL